MKPYLEKFKDPRWQKKRLEVFERDLWACQICFDIESTLNVHHRYYLKGHDPWDYPTESLITLCEDCHTKEKEGRAESEQELLYNLKRHLLSNEVQILANCFIDPKFCHAKDIVLHTIEFILDHEDEQKILVEKFFDNLHIMRGNGKNANPAT